MTTKFTDHSARERSPGARFRIGGMMTLTLIFVLLYGVALLGWVKPVTDDKLVSHLEPIIFVILGYYFGRLPADQNENTLKDEINRQAQRADAAQHAKEQAQQARESLEEKMKNVKAAIETNLSRIAENSDRAGGSGKDDNLRQSVAAAMSILKS